MDDEELIDALRTGLDAVDPPPASLLAKAVAAGTWPNGPAIEAQPRSNADLVGAGMRSSQEVDDETYEMRRDHSFESTGHTIDITIEFDSNRGPEDGVEVVVIITPRVDSLTIVSPFAEPVGAQLDASGRVALQLGQRALAVEFVTGSGSLVRTPLIRLS